MMADNEDVCVETSRVIERANIFEPNNVGHRVELTTAISFLNKGYIIMVNDTGQ